MFKKVFSWLLLLGWMGVIYWFSDRSQAVPQINPSLAKIVSIGGHVVFFGILYLFSTNALKQNFNWDNKKIMFTSLTFVLVYGILDEYHQSFIPGRDPSIYDVGWDLLGALITAVIASPHENN